jgi:hypothetical protein
MKDRSEYQRQYRKKNADILKQKRKAYLDNNKEMIKEGRNMF